MKKKRREKTRKSQDNEESVKVDQSREDAPCPSMKVVGVNLIVPRLR